MLQLLTRRDVAGSDWSSPVPYGSMALLVECNNKCDQAICVDEIYCCTDVHASLW